MDSLHPEAAQPPQSKQLVGRLVVEFHADGNASNHFEGGVPVQAAVTCLFAIIMGLIQQHMLAQSPNQSGKKILVAQGALPRFPT
jgi:hypothetical protein